MNEAALRLAIEAQALGIELAVLLNNLARGGEPGIPNSSQPGPLRAFDFWPAARGVSVVMTVGQCVQGTVRGTVEPHKLLQPGSTPGPATSFQDDEEILSLGAVVPISFKFGSSPATNAVVPPMHTEHQTGSGLPAGADFNPNAGEVPAFPRGRWTV